MRRWMRMLTKIHSYSYIVIGLTGESDRRTRPSGALHGRYCYPQVQWVLVRTRLFTMLFVRSVTDEYDPAGYDAGQ